MTRLTLMIIIFAASTITAVAGTGPQDIANTPHNLSSTGLSYTATNVDEICVFCHTPHGGSLDGPLWNREYTGGTAATPASYTFYSSDTLGATASAVATINVASLMCLSCHDGSLGVGDNLLNNPDDITPNNNTTKIESFFGEPGPSIGASRANDAATNDLSDDHPISFNYATAQGEANSNLNAIATPKGLGLRFYGAGQDEMECGTCHDPHVDYTGTGDADYRPFLAIPNTNSQMCLGCHIK